MTCRYARSGLSLPVGAPISLTVMNRLFTAWRRLLRADEGFTIIEATVSMALLAILVATVSAAILSSLSAIQRVRWYQQATALGNEAVENTRDLTFDDLVMSSADATVGADPLIDTSGPDPTFDPDGPGVLVPEKLVITPAGGAIDPHTLPTRTIDDQDYTIHRYVTWVDNDVQGGPDEDYKRVVVRIVWEDKGADRVYTTSTFITEARRGLPTPKFEVAPDIQEQTVDPGFQVVFSYGIENLGIVDTYDIDWTVPAGRIWTIIPYLETSGNDDFDAGDTVLIDTNGNGIRDTGSVGTGDDVLVHFVWTLLPADALGTEVIPFSVTSGADATESKIVSGVLNVGGASTKLYLHDNPFPPTGNQSTEERYLMTADIPTQSTLYNYSTDLDVEPGRLVQPGGSATSSRQTKAQWIYQAPEPLQLVGNLILNTWVANDAANCNQPVAIVAVIRQKNSANAGGGTVLGTATGTLNLTCSFQQIGTTIAVSHTVPKNKWVEVTLYINGTITNRPMRVAYDTTVYPSSLNIPTVVAP